MAKTNRTAEQMQAVEFAKSLWPEPIPEGLKFSTWRLKDKLSSCWANPELVERQAGMADVYVQCSLVPAGMDVRQRVTVKTAAGIPGVWLDVDVKGEAHKKANLPASRGEAETIFPVQPT